MGVSSLPIGRWEMGFGELAQREVFLGGERWVVGGQGF